MTTDQPRADAAMTDPSEMAGVQLNDRAKQRTLRRLNREAVTARDRLVDALTRIAELEAAHKHIVKQWPDSFAAYTSSAALKDTP